MARLSSSIILAGALAGTSATAQDRVMRNLWLIQPAPAPENEKDYASGDYVLKQRLLPSGLVELGQSAQLGGSALTAGTQLVEIQSGAGKIYCMPAVPKQKLIGASFQPCLVDEDADNDFDGWFNGVSQTKGLLSIAGNRPRKLKPVDAVPYATVDPATLRLDCFVGIERRNYFNIYSLESFMIAFGCGEAVERLTTPVSFKSTEMPREVNVLGARFTALSEAEGKMRIRVVAPMPYQPFGVVTTTTYRFY